jgi:hypothetical protein
MGDAAVHDVNFWRFDQSLADIGMLRFKAAHEKQVHEQIQIGSDGFAIDPQSAGEFGCIEEPGLLVCEYGPEPSQRFGGYAPSEKRNISFKVVR